MLEAQGGFGIEAKRLLRELERRRKERECLPNIRNFDKFQPLGQINLVTAISLELVRRNARMILDRSPKDEALIPSKKSKIRMEMSRNKARALKRTVGTYNCNDTCKDEPLASGRLESSKASKLLPRAHMRNYNGDKKPEELWLENRLLLKYP